MNIEGVECITLAHHFSEPVAHHEYYGTNKIVDDLSKFSGFSEGFVVINSSFEAKRDAITHQVIGL